MGAGFMLPSGGTGMMPKTGGTFTGPVYFASGTDYYVDGNGVACFAKVYNAAFNDYAEWFPRGEETEPGDLIALKTDGDAEYYGKASEKDSLVVGVHSDEYAHIIGGDYYKDSEEYFEKNMQNYIPVGLAGRCTVKVKKDVQVGDYLVPSDMPGVARAFVEGKDKERQIVGMVVKIKKNRCEGYKLAKVYLK